MDPFYVEVDALSTRFVNLKCEVYGQHPISQVVHADALVALDSWLEHYKGQVDLVYMDPPFLSGGSYKFTQRVGAKGWHGDKKMRIIQTGYDDAWPGGLVQYNDFMEKVITRCYELLSPTGSIYVHVDYRASAHIRILLDRIFGRRHFMNEIIWSYQSGGRAATHFARKHDTIFFYRRGKSCYFDTENIGELRGRHRRNHMKRNVDTDGRVYYSIKVSGKEYRYYEDDVITPGDVWTDISHLQQKDPERTGFDTQKPETLLKRIILSSCPKGGIVCDPFSGSGTTATVAVKHDRHILCCDHNAISIHLTRRRLSGINATFKVSKDILELKNLPTIAINTEPSSNGTKVALTNYRQMGGDPFYEVSLLPREDTLVDWWAVGHRINNTLHVCDHAMRTYDHADFGRLTLIDGEGIPCAIIVDVLGGCYAMDIEI